MCGGNRVPTTPKQRYCRVAGVFSAVLVLSVQVNGYPRAARTALFLFEALKAPGACATIKPRGGRDETTML